MEEAPAEIGEAPQPEVEIERIYVEVVKLLRAKQKIYGVNNGEYVRYASYCTRRSKRLRQLIGMKGGPKHDLSPNIFQNAEHVQILLYKADGAWARYRDLKNTATMQKHRAHAKRRLRKSLKWWDLAAQCAEAFCTPETAREIQAFRSYATASLELELSQWAEAFEQFATAVELFSSLAENEEISQFCQELIEDITPLLQFCRFNMGGSQMDKLSPELRARIQSIYAGGSGSDTSKLMQMNDLQWNGVPIKITNDNLVPKVGSILDLINVTQRNIVGDHQLTAFDRLIAESHSLRQQVHNLQQKDEAEYLKSLEAFLSYQASFATIGRSRVILPTIETPSLAAQFAAKTLVRITEVLEQFPEDADLMAVQQIWCGIRDISLAKVYEGVESASLSNKAVSYFQKAVELLVDPKFPALLGWANELLQESRKLNVSKISQTVIKKNKEQKKPFLADLDSFESADKLVETTVQPKVVVPKPIFYDFAGDFIEFPTLKHREETQKKKGIFGLFSR